MRFTLLCIGVVLTIAVCCSLPHHQNHPHSLTGGGRRLQGVDLQATAADISEPVVNKTDTQTVQTEQKYPPLPQECHYGTAPGIFNMESTAGTRWQLFSPRCQLRNYLAQYSDPKIAPTLPKVSILFMSDSMDMKLLAAYCNYTGSDVNKVDSHNSFNVCNQKDLPIDVAQVYLSTLTATDPVVIDKSIPGYKKKMAFAQENWKDRYGQDPTVVVMGGGLWDIYRWLKAPDENLAEIERSVKANHEISMELLDWWTAQAKEAIRHARTLYPNSKLVWRTYATPSFDPQTGVTHNANIGNKAFVVQMRAAGWAAAIDEGLEVVDVDSLVQEFPHPKMYLQDKHHAKSEIMLEVMNMIMNIAHQNTTAVTED